MFTVHAFAMRPCGAAVEALEPRAHLASYYLSPAGSDANAGTSPATAWQTISRANAHTFGPGDQVLLQAGATFARQWGLYGCSGKNG